MILSDAEEASSNSLEMIKYDESHIINLPFDI